LLQEKDVVERERLQDHRLVDILYELEGEDSI
jgi:hypothetical protein